MLVHNDKQASHLYNLELQFMSGINGYNELAHHCQAVGSGMQ